MRRRILHQTSPAKSRDPRAGQKRHGPAPSPPPPWRNWLLYVGLAVTLLLLFLPLGKAQSTELSYTQFLNKVAANQVKSATIDPDGSVTGTLSNGTDYTSQIPVALQDTTLTQQLREHRVQIVGKKAASNLLASIVVSLLPFLLLFGVFWYMGRRA